MKQGLAFDTFSQASVSIGIGPAILWLQTQPEPNKNGLRGQTVRKLLVQDQDPQQTNLYEETQHSDQHGNRQLAWLVFGLFT
jgi:hypothetical protein